MRRWIFSLLILSGCHEGNQDQLSSLLESPILNRPIVAIVPMIDHSRNDLTWNVSNELSQAIRLRLAQKDRLYLMGEEAVRSMATRNKSDPFDIDTAWMKKSFPQNEFVVFMELLEHTEVPIYATQDSPAELELAVRVRVFDLRKQTPHVVLQEIGRQVHHIPRQFNKVNFNQVPWGDDAFETSPLGVAHDTLCKEIASRVEDYILLSGH